MAELRTLISLRFDVCARIIKVITAQTRILIISVTFRCRVTSLVAR